MQNLQLIEKKQISDIEIKDNEVEAVEVEELPKTQEDIINDLLEKNERLREEIRRLNKINDMCWEELIWLKRYMKEHGFDYEKIDLESWKEDAKRRDRADYEKYGTMNLQQRKDYDESLERVREEMRRRRAQK